MRVDAARLTGSLLDGRIGSGSGGFGEVEGQQIGDVDISRALRQLTEDMAQVGEGFDAARSACQHQAVDDSA
jgi:hypothetical protein